MRCEPRRDRGQVVLLADALGVHQIAATRHRPGVLAEHPTLADLGYVGVSGIGIVPYKRFPGTDLNIGQIEFNISLSKTRAAVEHAIAHLKTWRMLSKEGGRYCAPIDTYASVVKAIVGLYFLTANE